MRRVLSGACAALLVCGCATQPATGPGTGSGAAYVPMVDMQGVQPAEFAADVDACRASALKVRVLDVKSERSDTTDAVVLAIGLVVPFGLVGMTAIAAISAAIDAGSDTVGRPADPPLQQNVLVNCMARKGYRNIDPKVTVTYVAPITPRAPLRTGQDAYVVEQFAKTSNCSAAPRPELESKGPGFEHYSVACADGQRMSVRCEFGQCTRQPQATDS